MKTHLKYCLLFLFVYGCSNEPSKDLNSIEEVTEQENLILPDDGKIIPKHWKDKYFSPREFIDLVKEENGFFTKNKPMDDLTFKLFYLPREYMAINDFKTDFIKKVDFEKSEKKYSEMVYFMMRIYTKTGIELAKYQLASNKDYDKRIRYYSFEMENDIQLVSETGKIITTAMYHFERSYNITPYSTFLIGFLKEDLDSEKITLQYHEKVFNKGKLKFQFNLDDYTNLPKLNLL